MSHILITGAASGLGLAFLNHYISNSANSITAIDRHPISIRKEGPATTSFHTLDVTHTSALSEIAATLQDKPIDILIHCVGVRGLVRHIHEAYPDDLSKADNLNVIDEDTIMRTFQINTLGTFLVIRTFLPNLKLCKTQAKVVILGSRMGSISYNTTGGAYAYRASKAALNAMVKSFSIDVSEVLFILMHPGRVETGIVLCREEGAIEAEESVRDMLQTMDKLSLRDSGRFIDRFGETIGW